MLLDVLPRRRRCAFHIFATPTLMPLMMSFDYVMRYRYADYAAAASRRRCAASAAVCAPRHAKEMRRMRSLARSSCRAPRIVYAAMREAWCACARAPALHMMRALLPCRCCAQLRARTICLCAFARRCCCARVLRSIIFFMPDMPPSRCQLPRRRRC